MADSSVEAEQLVRNMADIWNGGDYASLPTIASESIVMTEPALVGRDEVPGPDGEAHGIAGVEKWMRIVEDEWTDWTVEILSMVAGEDQAMLETEISGRYDPTGADVEFRCMERYDLRAGKIEAWRLYYDRIDVGQQMGLL